MLNSSAVFYFYDDFFIVKSDNSIEKVPYNKIIIFKEYKSHFAIGAKSRGFFIEKDKIDDKFYNFLKELKNQYKNIKSSSDDKVLDDNLHDYIGKYKMYCVNDKNEETLDKYYHTEKIYRILYINVLCINSILILAFFTIFDIFFKTFIEIAFLIIFIIIITNFSIPNHIKSRIKVAMQSEAEKLYFYDEYFLIKADGVILKCKYSNIKFFIEDDKLVFMKLKSLLSPIIIDKQIPLSVNFDLLGKLKASTK